MPLLARGKVRQNIKNNNNTIENLCYCCLQQEFLVFCFVFCFLSVQPFSEFKDLGRIELLSSSLRAFIASTVNKGFFFSNKTILSNSLLVQSAVDTVNKPSTDCHEQPIH